MDRETVPFCAQFHEQVVEDRVRSHPCPPAGHIGIALGQRPSHLRGHRSQNGRYVSATKRFVEIFQKPHVVHGLSCDRLNAPLHYFNSSIARTVSSTTAFPKISN